MEANETSGVKRRFWNRRKLLVVIASVATVVLLAGLLVWFSAPKNELLTEMPTQQSRLRFLGPLRQPVSDAWQRFRKARLNPAPTIPLITYQLDTTQGLPPDLGLPTLTNEIGVSAWIVPKDKIDALLKKPELVRFDSDGPAADGEWVLTFVKEFPALCRIRKRTGGGHGIEVFVVPGYGEISGTNTIGSGTASTNHPSLKPFGAQVTAPKGSAVLILGPIPESNRTDRFVGLFIPE